MSWGAGILFPVLFLAGLALGSAPLSPEEVVSSLIRPFSENPPFPAAHLIVWKIRLPRVLLTLLVGGALASAGAAVQGLFRNPLASPDLLGISAGGSLGALITIYSGLTAVGLIFLPLFSILFSIASGLLIYLLATKRGQTSLLFLLLAGMALSSLINSLISGILLFAREQQISQFLFWTMGGFENRQWKHVLLVLPFLIPGLFYLILQAGNLNLLLYGEETAHSLGLSVQRKKRGILLAAAILTGGSVSVSGTIGFVGLLVPHICRFFTGPDHRRLLPASFFFGGGFLLFCDIIARTAFAPLEIKTGIVTALFGAPYFIFLIIRYQKQGYYGIFNASHQH